MKGEKFVTDEIANKVMQQLFVTLEMKYEFTLTN